MIKSWGHEWHFTCRQRLLALNSFQMLLLCITFTDIWWNCFSQRDPEWILQLSKKSDAPLLFPENCNLVCHIRRCAIWLCQYALLRDHIQSYLLTPLQSLRGTYCSLNWSNLTAALHGNLDRTGCITLPLKRSLFLFLPCPPFSKHLYFDRSGNFHLTDWRLKLLLVRHTDSCPALLPLSICSISHLKRTSPIILILHVSRPLESRVWALCVSSGLFSFALEKLSSKKRAQFQLRKPSPVTKLFFQQRDSVLCTKSPHAR